MRFTNSFTFATAMNANTATEAGSPDDFATLDAMMTTPAETTGDVISKVSYLRGRDAFEFCTEARDGQAPVSFIALIERDLADLARLTPSSGMRAHFTEVAAWILAVESAEYGPDGQLPEITIESERQAHQALFKCPCTNAGDFIVKAYLSLLGRHGAHNHGFPFIPNIDLNPGEDEPIRDHHEDAAMFNDLIHSDLGQCMMGLGRIDFDARTWIDGMERLGHNFTVLRDGEGRSFWQDADLPDGSAPWDELRHQLLTYVLNGGNHKDRTRAVADLIEAEYPHRVLDLTGRGQDTPAIADAVGA